MQERAAIIGGRSDRRTDDRLEQMFAMIGAEAAVLLGVAKYGLEVGRPASLLTLPAHLPAHGVPEAIAQHRPRRLVPFNGRLVARDGTAIV